MVQSSSNKLVHVVDDVFPQDILHAVQQWANQLPEVDTWYEFENMFYGNDLVEMAKEYFDLTGAIGCEMHRNYLQPKPHHDKDEKLYATTGEMKFPLCGIVYYPFIAMRGGHLIFPEAEIAVGPKTNRAVFFRCDLFHDGVPFEGVRQSVGINPWTELPLAYKGE